MQPVRPQQRSSGRPLVLAAFAVFAVALGSCQSKIDGVIEEYDVKHGTVNTVAIVRDETTVIVGGDSFGIRIFDRKSGNEIRHIADAKGTIAISPDGTRALSIGGFSTALMWDLTNGAETNRLVGHDGQVCSAAFSPDNSLVITGSGLAIRKDKTKSVHGDYIMRLWNVKSGQEIQKFVGHKGPVAGVAFSPDQKRVASYSLDRTMRVWDVETGRELGRTPDKVWSELEKSFDTETQRREQDSYIIGKFACRKQHAFSYSHDGRFLLRGLTLYHAEKLELVRRFDEGLRPPQRCEVTSQFSPDGKRILSGHEDGTIRLWDRESGKELWQARAFNFKESACVHALAFSPDGKLALTGGEGVSSENFGMDRQDCTVRLWKLPE